MAGLYSPQASISHSSNRRDGHDPSQFHGDTRGRGPLSVLRGRIGTKPTQAAELSSWSIVASAVICWAALLLQLFLTLRLTLANGMTAFQGLAHYLSYFTILTNLLVAVAFSLRLVWTRSAAAVFFRRPSVVTGICVCILGASIGYNVLLRDLWHPQGLQRLADELLHVVTAVLFTVYWWCAVPHGSISWRSIPWWLLYPAAYLGYMLLRGAVLGHYPYPFLDVAALGYGRTLLNAAGVAVSLVVVGAGFVLLKRGQRRGAPG